MSKDSVSRKKYDALKEKAERWRDKAEDCERRYEDVLAENEQLVLENEELQENRFSSTDIAKYGEMEETIRVITKELEEANDRISALEDEVTTATADAQRYRKQYKEERKKMRDLEKETQVKAMVDSILSQKLPKP